MSDKIYNIVSILDRSGSMQGSEVEVIGAYNSFVEEQQRLARENDVRAYMTLVLFDDRYDLVYRKLPMYLIPTLTSETYYTRGMTALYDAIGKTIAAFDDEEKCLFFIETDGHENSSQEYRGDTIKNLIRQKTEKGWDFNFVGADLTKETTIDISSHIGISADKTMAFNKTAEGYSARNELFTDVTRAFYEDNS